MNRNTTFTRRSLRLVAGLFGCAFLVTAPWVSADASDSAATPLAGKADGKSCSTNADCDSNKCVQLVAREVKMPFNRFTHRGAKYCTAKAKACPRPGQAGSDPGESYQLNSFGRVVCKSDSEYIFHDRARELGRTCSTGECLHGSCRGIDLNDSGRRVCTTSGKCPRDGSGGDKVGTVRGRLTCAAPGKWKLSAGQGCYNRAAKRTKANLSNCASKKCLTSFDRKSYCVAADYTCALKGRPGAKTGARYKGGLTCTTRGWQRKR